jgi:hypothetical protein
MPCVKYACLHPVATACVELYGALMLPPASTHTPSTLVPAQVADEYLDVPEFYYPHTVDFRGRAYPLHPSLHHLGEAAVTPPTQRGLHHGRLVASAALPSGCCKVPSCALPALPMPRADDVHNAADPFVMMPVVGCVGVLLTSCV